MNFLSRKIRVFLLHFNLRQIFDTIFLYSSFISLYKEKLSYPLKIWKHILASNKNTDLYNVKHLADRMLLN